MGDPPSYFMYLNIIPRSMNLFGIDQGGRNGRSRDAAEGFFTS